MTVWSIADAAVDGAVKLTVISSNSAWATKLAVNVLGELDLPEASFPQRQSKL